MTDEVHPPSPELPERSGRPARPERPGPGPDWLSNPGRAGESPEVAGDPDEEAALEAALLAEIQRSMAGDGPDDPGPATAAGPRSAPGGRGDLVPGEIVLGAPRPDEGHNVRLTAWLRGRVQGVGFRWWARSRALELGLSGWAENLADGRVKVVAEGPREVCAQLLALLDSGDTPGQVDHVTHRWDAARGGLDGFAEC